MPKKKLKKRKKKIIKKKNKTKSMSLAPKQEKELLYRTKKDWISKALVNKSCLLYTSPSPRDTA